MPIKNKMPYYKTFILVYSASIFLSCSKEKAEPQSSCFDQSFQASFSTDVFPVIQLRCASVVGCHAPGSAPNPEFSDYNSVKAKYDDGKLWNRLIELKDMSPAWAPDSLKLTDCEREAIQKWMEIGALNN